MVFHSQAEPIPDPLPPNRAARQKSTLHDAGTDALIRDIRSLPDDAPTPIIGRIGFPTACPVHPSEESSPWPTH
jgi:hypothetical protein